MEAYIAVLYSSAAPSASSIETSTCWPPPLTARCSSAASTATQALIPAKYSAASPPGARGSLSGAPVVYIGREGARKVRELPGKPLYGPACPNVVTEQ